MRTGIAPEPLFGGVIAAEAFTRLRPISQAERVRVADVAPRIGEDAVRRPSSHMALANRDPRTVVGTEPFRTSATCRPGARRCLPGSRASNEMHDDCFHDRHGPRSIGQHSRARGRAPRRGRFGRSVRRVPAPPGRTRPDRPPLLPRDVRQCRHPWVHLWVVPPLSRPSWSGSAPHGRHCRYE